MGDWSDKIDYEYREYYGHFNEPDREEETEEEDKGKWRHYEGMLYCSQCGAEFYDEIMEYTGDEVPKFCPDCGADMRGE